MKATGSRVVTVAIAVLAIAFIGARMLRNQRMDATHSGNHETGFVVQSRNVEEADARNPVETPENSSPHVVSEAMRLQVFEAREEMFRNGAQAKITLRVVDSLGAPVSGAHVQAHFTFAPDPDPRKTIINGDTTEDGFFTAEHRTTYQCRWRITKDGYYGTHGAYEWQSKFTMEGYRSGRWQPWNPTVEVVLKEKRNPIETPSFVHNPQWKTFPRNTRIGYDLETNDFVSQIGKGAVTDLYFLFQVMVDTNATGRVFTWRLTLTAKEDDGFVVLPKDSFSEFISCYEAPVDGYVDKLVYTYKRTPHKILEDSRPKESEYIIVRSRTQRDADGSLVSALHGAIYRFDMDNRADGAQILLGYYFNPEGRNLEIAR